MSDTTLTPTRFENGIWEGYLTGTNAPRIEVQYLGEVLLDTELTPDGEGWNLRVLVPVSALSEGVHSFVISDASTRAKLGSFTVIAGAPAADDLRAEVDLLRAELDMLKRAFRRLHNPDE